MDRGCVTWVVLAALALSCGDRQVPDAAIDSGDEGPSCEPWWEDCDECLSLPTFPTTSVDILVVVDGGPGSHGAQARLAEGLDTLLGTLESSPSMIDWRIGVTTTDMGPPACHPTATRRRATRTADGYRPGRGRPMSGHERSFRVCIRVPARSNRRGDPTQPHIGSSERRLFSTRGPLEECARGEDGVYFVDPVTGRPAMPRPDVELCYLIQLDSQGSTADPFDDYDPRCGEDRTSVSFEVITIDGRSPNYYIHADCLVPAD